MRKTELLTILALAMGASPKKMVEEMVQEGKTTKATFACLEMMTSYSEVMHKFKTVFVKLASTHPKIIEADFVEEQYGAAEEFVQMHNILFDAIGTNFAKQDSVVYNLRRLFKRCLPLIESHEGKDDATDKLIDAARKVAQEFKGAV